MKVFGALRSARRLLARFSALVRPHLTSAFPWAAAVSPDRGRNSTCADQFLGLSKMNLPGEENWAGS